MYFHIGRLQEDHTDVTGRLALPDLVLCRRRSRPPYRMDSIFNDHQGIFAESEV